MVSLSQGNEDVESKFEHAAREPVAILEDTETEPEVSEPDKKETVQRVVQSSEKIEEEIYEQSHYAASVKAIKQEETLSTLPKADITSEGPETDPFTTSEERDNALTWDEFIANEAMKTNTHPAFLFRAHIHVGANQPTFIPDLHLPFNPSFRRDNSIEKFAALLEKHLIKTHRKFKTYFVSMSPNLEWTIHTTVLRHRKIGHVANKEAGLAIFDVNKLRQSSETSIFRVSNVLDFLERRGQNHLIRSDLRKWAGNCDEYVSMGTIPNEGLVKWVAWKEISELSPPLISVCFVEAKWLSEYRKEKDKAIEHVESEDLCQRILAVAKVLAEGRDDLLRPLTDLILKPRINFWGFKTDVSDDMVKQEIYALIDELTLQNLSRLSLR